MKTMLRVWFWRLLGKRRRAGAYLAARSRRLNRAAEQDKIKSCGVVGTSNGAPAPLSVLESVADQKSGGAA